MPTPVSYYDIQPRNNYAYSGKLLWLTTLITMPTPVSYYDIQPRNNYTYSGKLLWHPTT